MLCELVGVDDKIGEVVDDVETEPVCVVKGEELRLDEGENETFEVIDLQLDAEWKAENELDTDAHVVDDALLEDVAVYELIAVFEELLVCVGHDDDEAEGEEDNVDSIDGDGVCESEFENESRAEIDDDAVFDAELVVIGEPVDCADCVILPVDDAETVEKAVLDSVAEDECDEEADKIEDRVTHEDTDTVDEEENVRTFETVMAVDTETKVVLEGALDFDVDLSLDRDEESLGDGVFV